jgi:DNA-binding transcriptional ArsR family regulator
LDVGDVAADGCCAKSTLSHHLAELRNAGLILCEKKGRRIICRANPEAVSALRDIFALRPESED